MAGSGYKAGDRLVVLYDFAEDPSAHHATCLQVKKGEHGVAEHDAAKGRRGWIVVKISDDRVGFVPESYVNVMKSIPASAASPDPVSAGQVVARLSGESPTVTDPGVLCWGVSVADIVGQSKGGGKVVHLVDEVIGRLEKLGGKGKQGIFRYPGSKTNIDAIKANYAEGAHGDAVTLLSDKVYDWASILQEWNKQLLPRLIPWRRDSPEMTKLVGLPKPGAMTLAAEDELEALLSTLPDGNRQTLSRILGFLRGISVHACPEGHIALLLGSSLFDSTDSFGIEDGGYMMTTLKECCEKMLSVHRPPDCGLNVPPPRDPVPDAASGAELRQNDPPRNQGRGCGSDGNCSIL